MPVVLMLFPTLFDGSWTPDTYPLRPIFARVGAVATSLGIHVLDLTPVFAAQGGRWERWRAMPYDGHPNAAAYGHVARALASYVVQNRLLPSGETTVTCHGMEVAPVGATPQPNAAIH